MKKTLDNFCKKYRELIVYCLIGCTGATLDFVVYFTLMRFGWFHYQVANFISVSMGIVNNFFWNCFFNFKTRNHMMIRLGSFYCVGMLGWALSAGCLWVFIDQLNFNVLVAKLSTIFFVTLVQFCLNKIITFRKDRV